MIFIFVDIFFVLEDIHFNANEVAGLVGIPLKQFKAMVDIKNSFLSKIYAKECAALDHLGLI